MFKLILGLWILALLAIGLRAFHVVDCSWTVALIPLWVSLAVDIMVGGMIVMLIQVFSHID